MQAQRHASLFAGEVQQSLAAALLFTPRECSRPERDVMTLEEVKKACKALPLRERLIVKLAVLAGMRPGEIFGLRRGHVGESYASVSQRVYRGDIDTPKTVKSLRKVALPEGLRQDLKTWLATRLIPDPQTHQLRWQDPIGAKISTELVFYGSRNRCLHYCQLELVSTSSGVRFGNRLETR
jgi:integrase